MDFCLPLQQLTDSPRRDRSDDSAGYDLQEFWGAICRAPGTGHTLGIFVASHDARNHGCGISRWRKAIAEDSVAWPASILTGPSLAGLAKVARSPRTTDHHPNGGVVQVWQPLASQSTSIVGRYASAGTARQRPKTTASASAAAPVVSIVTQALAKAPSYAPNRLARKA